MISIKLLNYTISDQDLKIKEKRLKEMKIKLRKKKRSCINFTFLCLFHGRSKDSHPHEKEWIFRLGRMTLE